MAGSTEMTPWELTETECHSRGSEPGGHLEFQRIGPVDQPEDCTICQAKKLKS